MLRLKNLSKYYHETGNVVKALDAIDLTFKNNEFVVITGESGSGKSTLLNVISGLDTYEDGELYFLDQETAYFSKSEWETYRKNNIGFIFQNYNLIEAYTVFENVEMAAFIKGMETQERKKRVLDLIERVGLKGKEKQKTSTLSGGEKQRVAIARALAKDAPMIIADEPTGNLDKKTGESILTLLKEIAEDKLVLLVSHSFESVEPYATRHVRLFDGEVTLDKELSKVEKTASVQETQTESLSWINLMWIAFKNLVSTPKRSVFTLLISVFIVIVFALVYGSYVQQINSVGEGHVPGFNNVTENRLIVTKSSEEAFSDEEINDFYNKAQVIDVLDYDIMLDVNVSIPYVNGQSSFTYGDGAILPSTVFNERDLESGRLPENTNEVVISHDDYEIGDILSLSFSSRFRGRGESDYTTYTTKEVVGIAPSTQRFSFTLYTDPDFFNDPVLKAYAFFINEHFIVGTDERGYGVNFFEVNITDSVDVGDIWVSEYLRNQIELPTDQATLSLTYKEQFSNIDYEHTFDVTTESSGDDSDTLRMHPETFSQIFESIPPYQITLLVSDNFDAQRVIETIDDETYNTLYPIAQNDPLNTILRIMMSIFLGGLSLGVAFIMYFIGYISLKNVMTAKKKDYVILRSIGLSKNELNRVTTFEMIMNMTVALLLVFMGLMINDTVLHILPDYLRYYNTFNYLFLIVVLLGMSVFLAFRFNKKLFDISVISAFKEQ